MTGYYLTTEQLSELSDRAMESEGSTIPVDVDAIMALVDEVIEYRNLEGIEDLRTQASEKLRSTRLASIREYAGLTDEQAIEGVKNGTLVEPFYAEWMVLLGRGDIL